MRCHFVQASRCSSQVAVGKNMHGHVHKLLLNISTIIQQRVCTHTRRVLNDGQDPHLDGDPCGRSWLLLGCLSAPRRLLLRSARLERPVHDELGCTLLAVKVYEDKRLIRCHRRVMQPLVARFRPCVPAAAARALPRWLRCRLRGRATGLAPHHVVLWEDGVMLLQLDRVVTAGQRPAARVEQREWPLTDRMHPVH